jgi:hypothetical protein
LAGVYIEAFRFLEENVHMGIDDRDGYEGGRSLEFTGVYHNGRVGKGALRCDAVCRSLVMGERSRLVG